MTTSTICSKLPIMPILRGMAGITIRGSAFIDAIAMAGSTGHSGVTTGQCEAGPAVVKVDVIPAARVMTIGTVPSHLPGMNILMTRCTRCGRALEQNIIMATRTWNTDMPAHQMERGHGVVERYILPGRGPVARFAILSQHTLVRIVCLMTGETIHGRAFEHIVDVTVTAGHIDVRR